MFVSKIFENERQKVFGKCLRGIDIIIISHNNFNATALNSNVL